jgi:hypothetical protein
MYSIYEYKYVYVVCMYVLYVRMFVYHIPMYACAVCTHV